MNNNYIELQLQANEELQEILLDHADSIDCRVRIAKLTSTLISNKGFKE